MTLEVTVVIVIYSTSILEKTVDHCHIKCQLIVLQERKKIYPKIE